MPDVVRGWGAEEEAEVSNGVSNGGFEPRTRDTLGGVRKEIPIPSSPSDVDDIDGNNDWPVNLHLSKHLTDVYRSVDFYLPALPPPTLDAVSEHHK